ncbi:glycosyltransferase involved in cell wall biosynthesis [Rhodoblastus acidophilus]|uniref:glycosyltransferase family 2 protein n=1 Tax=Rhodoblastus acidophilus TaxID=1074 RepID=UPI00222536C7|nr:glycosyltransferase family 2 protein [Rhodoblastus acidophilus]MCW2284284.1 glycosyltransferase involved in cell wall biosynthesis [Rhodoblastus acidophilus]MCW2333238.1 glycosyltransferase involved in cell wall biosynthesis [Rhodoblastus acidophilus]
MLNITVVVPVRNEEKNLPRCLDALVDKFVAVVVVDSSSTDRTAEIAAKYGVEFVQFDWNGRFPKKRNWMLLNYAFKTEWVLFIDADEIVSDAFVGEVSRAVREGAANAYWLRYTNVFLGKTLHFGVPQRKIALIKRGAGLYERIDEQRWSNLDMEVHEHPIIDGPVGEIRMPIRHEDDRGILKFIEKHADYAAWEARRLFELRQGGNANGLTLRQKVKYGYVDQWWFAHFYFFYTYILRLGVLDGSAGFYYAFYKLWYFMTVRRIHAECQEK